MGGKTKQSQRTKNNARPSSSGRSADLLSSVKLDSGIVNIAGTQLPALFPSLVAPSVDPLVSPELQLCLKKLNKKDPITKTKALQELSELVTNSEVDDVVSSLASWSHFYKILTADPDRKVRECTQSCHGAIVAVCGRRIAPHLKQLMPAWLQAQYDEHAPAQTHAVNSLAKTFPDTKLPEVLSFCKEPVVSNLLDVLVGNGETAHIRKTDSAEEREMLVARVISSSLHGLQYACLNLPSPHSAWLWGELARLLQNSAFWKRATHTDVKIRAAWFGAIGSIISRYKGEFGAAYGVKTLRVLIGVRESNPLAAAQLWECLLLFMHNVPEWHQYLEKKELLSKRILDLLESGGWGDARHLSNMLLPILASLPEEILTTDFHIAFFTATLSGLEKKTIVSSKSERQYWIGSLEECLRYVSLQPRARALAVVPAAQRAWLRAALAGAAPARCHLIKHSAASMANLLKYWLKQAEVDDTDKYDRLIGNFWQNIGSTLTTQIDRLPPNNEDVETVMDAHILLLQTLKTSFTQEPKKRHSIKFEADVRPAEEKPTAAPRADPALVDRYNRDLNELVQNVCGHYFQFASSKQISNPVISPLITLLVQFDSESLFVGVARQFGCSSVYELYDKVLRSWLTGDTMRCRAVVDIVFMLMWHLTESDQDAVFNSFKQFPPSAVEWCLSLALSHPARQHGSARRWLRGALAGTAVTSLSARLGRGGAGPARQLLLLSLNADVDGESVISAEAVETTLQQLSASLYDVNSPALEARSGVAAQLATTLPPNATLLTALLSLTTTLQRGDARLSLDTWCEVRDAWQDGVMSLPPHARACFLRDAAAMLHAQLNLNSNLAVKSPQSPDSSTEPKDKSSAVLNIAKIEHIVSLCPYLLWCSSELDIPEVIQFTQTIFDIAPTDPMLIESYATRHEILAGNLNCPSEDNAVIQAITNETLTELCKHDLVEHVNTVLFRMMYLRTMFLNRPDDESDRNWCKELLSEKYFEGEFVKCVYDYAVICSLYEGYAFWPHYKLIEQSKNRLGTLLEDIIKETSRTIRSSISNTLSELSLSKGYFWAYARKYVQTNMNEDSTTNEGSSQIDEGSSQIDEGCSQIDEACSQIDEVSSQIDEGCSQIDEACSQIEEACSQIDEGRGSSRIEEVSGQNELESSQVETNSSRDTESEEIISAKIPFELTEDIAGPAVLHILHHLQANSKDSSDPLEVMRNKYYIAVANLYAAHEGERALRAALLRDVAAAAAPAAPSARTPDPDPILNAYYAHNHTMLFDKDISNAPWKQIVSNASICSFLSSRVVPCGWSSEPRHWDFTNITLCSLLTSVELSKHNWGSTKVAVVARAALELYCATRAFVAAVPRRGAREAARAHVARLPAEWRAVYAPALRRALLALMLHALESSSKTVNSNRVAVLAALIRCAPLVEWDAVVASASPDSPSPSPSPSGQPSPAHLARVVAACTSALQRPVHSAFKYLAYSVLKMLLKLLVLEDAEKLAAWSNNATEDDEAAESPLELTLLYYDDAFFHLQDIVETAVSHVRVCEEVCTMVAASDAHGLALGLLLLADVLARQCALARQDLTHQYIQIYRERKYTEPLLTIALRLLPEAILTQAASTVDSPFHNNTTNTYKDMFTSSPQLDVYKWCGGSALAAAACRCVWWCVRGAGAACARGWRGAAHHRHAQLLDNITRRYITPHVVKEEFALLLKNSSSIEDTEITINWSCYEVSCVLMVDDKPIELVVALSRQHPLVLPKLTAEHSAAGNINWILMYLGYQNGTILNALKMWTVSVNNKMERAPQCYICYCRLHHATGRLPSVHCHTCRNRFHNVCLRKWFRSSSKMTCPLCRSNF